ncbi:MAG: carboxypeptidase-like regulatory domain-containing protein, partial [Bacteroides sp.]|nr:carboxypeptidase-like regulatory domain-containing protein [Bacteroides sp.]
MKYKFIALAILACVSLKGLAQEESGITGKVVDKAGNPVEGALITVEGNALVYSTTNRDGVFAISAENGNLLRVRTGSDDTKVVPVKDQKNITVVLDFSTEKVNYGFGLDQTNAVSTGAV